MTKQITIGDIGNEDQFNAAFKLYREASPGTFAKRCAEEIITPILPEINARIGQENDARYLAYVLELAFMENYRA